MWARKYDNCILCNKTEYLHKGHGKCKRCYQQESVRNKKSWVVRRWEKDQLKRKFKRYILNQETSQHHTWKKVRSNSRLIKVRSERTGKIYKTPYKINEIEQNINNIRFFKKVLDEVRL